MSLFLPDPAAPGTVDPQQLGKVRELHGIVRDWIERSAVAQKNDHLRANMPYVDLMFAFGFATLGDHATANRLVEDARKVMEGPIPAVGSPLADQAVIAAVVQNCLLKGFRCRVQQALSGKPHIGPLSDELLNELESIGNIANRGPVNNSYKLAAFVINRLREISRILEPSERIDQYADWSKHGDALKKALAELQTIREPLVVAERIRKLYRDGLPDKHIQEVRFYTLLDGLPQALRVGEGLAVELLAHVSTVILGGIGTGVESPDLPRKQGELLECAMLLAGHFNRADIVQELSRVFAALVNQKEGISRSRLVNTAGGRCLRILRKLNLQAEIELLLAGLDDALTGDVSLDELRARHGPRPEGWAINLQSLLHMASGWMMLGQQSRAEPIMAEARDTLLATKASMPAANYTDLARTYVSALGDAPQFRLDSMMELFREMDLRKITNTWTTAHFYSRFHLELVEATVFAACEICLENPLPVTVTA